MRMSWNAYFMQAAHLAAQRSTCDRMMPEHVGVGAVLVRDNVQVAMGYNGSPRGVYHCSDFVCNTCGHRYPEGSKVGVTSGKFQPGESGTRIVVGEVDAALGVPCRDSHCHGTLGPGHKLVKRYDENGSLVGENCVLTVHAEHNAILNAAREGVSARDCTLYSTHLPCWNCALAIIQVGIKKVVYDVPYKPGDSVRLLSDYLHHGLHFLDDEEGLKSVISVPSALALDSARAERRLARKR